MDFVRRPDNEEKPMKLLFKEKKKGTCFLLLRRMGRDESKRWGEGGGEEGCRGRQMAQG